MFLPPLTYFILEIVSSGDPSAQVECHRKKLDTFPLVVASFMSVKVGLVEVGSLALLALKSLRPLRVGDLFHGLLL